MVIGTGVYKSCSCFSLFPPNTGRKRIKKVIHRPDDRIAESLRSRNAMSKKKDTHNAEGSHDSSGKALTVIIILCFLGILPVLVWVSLPESAPYESVTTGSQMVQLAAHDAGLEICGQTPVAVDVPGATSAVLYSLSPSCSGQSSATTVQILVLGFSSTEALNAAIYQAQIAAKDLKPVNIEGFYSGYNAILVHGPAGSQDVAEISASLISQGAVRIL
jgi:hypothetical protein